MRIATNVHRDAFAGIAVSNLVLFDWLASRGDTIIGIEHTTTRSFEGARLFQHYKSTFFSHYIINCFDIYKRFSWQAILSETRLRKKWAVLLDETKAALIKSRADVVVINGTYSAPWLLAQAAHDLHIPIVLRYAGILKKEATHLKFLDRWRLLHHERAIARLAHTTVFPSSLCKKTVEEEILRAKTVRGFIVPNPVSLPAHQRRTHRIPSTIRIIASIGRWNAVKNFQAFAAIHSELLRQHWKHEAHLVTTAQATTSTLIPPTIHIIPPMDQEELNHFYQGAGLIVVPSHFETFCNVAVEAVLRGTPVLISEQVGAADCLRAAGLERMIIPSFSDIPRAAEAVKQLYGSRISPKERARLKAILDPSTVHHQLLKIVQAAVEEYHRPAGASDEPTLET